MDCPLYDPMDLLGKLAALVPPPRFNQVRYHGILAPAARWRSRIVPVESQEGKDSRGCPACSEAKKDGQGNRQENPGKIHPRNYSWAELMKRVWGFDVLKCDSCGGRMRILCAINPPAAIKKILDCLGLPSRPPPIYPAVTGVSSYY